MNIFNKLVLFLFLFLNGFNIFSTEYTAGIWKNYWEASEEVRHILLGEYKAISTVKKYIGKPKYLASRNTLAVLLHNSKALILISGLIPFYDYDRKFTCSDYYYDFSKIFLGEADSFYLKNILHSRMFFVETLAKIISQISEPNKELLNLISDYNFSALPKDLLKSLIAQNIKLSQLKRFVDAKDYIFETTKDSPDKDKIHELITFIENSVKEKVDCNILIHKYLKKLKDYFSFLIDYHPSQAEPALKQLENLEKITAPLQSDLDLDLLDLISKERLNNKILPFMHTETLLIYILKNNLLGTDIRPILSSDNKLVILSTRDMCRVCETCMSKFSTKQLCIVGSLEENDESWNRENPHQDSLIKIPLDADNTNSAINAVYNFRLSGLQIPQTTDLAQTTIIKLDRTHILERFLSRRMQAFLPFSKDKIRIYAESLSKPFNQLLVYRISSTKDTSPISPDPIYIVPLITNIDLHIIQGIRVHQLAFTELYKGERNTVIENIRLLHEYCPDKADNPIIRFIDYLEQFRPMFSSLASALSSSVPSISLDKKE